ncbi:hypothetical protein GQ42DRAFT_181748 [Ramicandelaber brevisporus]|nr:hypothetical protein GQ42DRAFT_181748 [Ramicandelaber brevisporus]
MHHVLDPSSLAARASGQYDAARYAREHFRRATPADYESASLASVKTTRQYLLRESSSQAPRIFYCSRTHKQLEQVAAEMERYCAYQPRMVVLGSRTNYCINERVNPGCLAWTNELAGRGISNMDMTAAIEDVIDIEDVVSVTAASSAICAQVGSKKKSKSSSASTSSASSSGGNGGSSSSGSIRDKCMSEVEQTHCMPHNKLQALLSNNGKGHSAYSAAPVLRKVHDIKQLVQFARDYKPTNSSKKSQLHHPNTGCSSNPDALCPYFLARDMASSDIGAELVLAPYKYIMDPFVCKATGLDLTNAIVIIDEAHNVEKELRDSMSIVLTNTDLFIIRQWVNEVTRRILIGQRNADGEYVDRIDHEPIGQLADKFMRLIENGHHVLEAVTNTDPKSHPKSHPKSAGGKRRGSGHGSGSSDNGGNQNDLRVWKPVNKDSIGPNVRKGDVVTQQHSVACMGKTGTARILSVAGIDSHFLHQLMDVVKDASALRKTMVLAEAKSQRNKPKASAHRLNGMTEPFNALSEPILHLIEKLIFILMAAADPNTGERFAFTVQAFPTLDREDASLDRYFSSSSDEVQALPKSTRLLKPNSILRIDCLAPDVPFAMLTSKVRSVILASGTLTPMQAMASELCHPFPHMVSTAHVITKKQVWAGAHSRAANGTELQLTRKTLDTENIKAAIGETLLQVVNKVRGGVLVFFASYSALETMSEYWKKNGIMNKIEDTKHVMKEPRRASSIEIAKFVADYREIITANLTGSSGKMNGCVLFAVCRGKLAEGVDFPDDMCRAVVIVGVPMASLESPGVTLKIRYNDRRHQDTKNRACKKGSDGSDIPYISGDQWYRTDAYRAVNQALGRSVRHSKDWGAMYLIETRYTDPKNTAYLSGWIKDSFIRFTSAKAASNDLTQFLKGRQG